MLPRSALARSNAFTLRRAVARRSTVPRARFQSTSSSSSSSSSSFNASHVAAGMAGGTLVVLAGYAWYHTSGLKTAVQTSKDVKQYLQTTRDNVINKARETSKNPSQALANLRGMARSYTFFIPGASDYVDQAFEEVQGIYEMHIDEMDSILKEITNALMKAAEQGGADTKTAMKVYQIFRDGVGRMKELGKKAGSDLLDKNPPIKEKLGSAYEQLQTLAVKAGPEGWKALSEVGSKIKDLASKGKLDEDSVKKVRDLIQEKTTSLRKRSDSSGGSFLSSEADKIQQLFKNVPDVDELLKKAPNVQNLLNIVQDRSEDAKKLAKETVSDVVAVLEEKGKKAKELSERTKADAEKQSK